MFKLRAAAVAATLLVSITSPSYADIVLARTSLPVFSFTGSTLVPINGGSPTVGFVAPAAGTVAISFTAECAISGSSSESVSIQILVDNVPIAPTVGITDAFCSAAVTSANTDGATSAAVVTTARVTKGPHTIKVQATPTGGIPAGRVGRLEARSLVVWR